jgi:hypothetical protein
LGFRERSRNESPETLRKENGLTDREGQKPARTPMESMDIKQIPSRSHRYDSLHLTICDLLTAFGIGYL